MEEFCKENICKVNELQKENKVQEKSILELLETQKKILVKLDEVLPTIREINNMRNAWLFTGRFMGVIVKIVIGVGVLIGAIYSIKSWIKGN